jgi:crotonobetainyl-CoA:carnitine CoA-transferase CaiB-like acyl-CoA transferase
MKPASGPLVGLRVLEFAGLGPAPFCGMLLSDLGADVVRIDRPGGRDYDRFDVETRGRRSVLLDLKTPAGVDTALALLETADALIEGFRPGVMERLGLGPERAQTRNPRLIYGRMTGWGQTGAYANLPGHDITYAALSGALHAIGPPQAPAIPLNLVGDFGGGALYLCRLMEEAGLCFAPVLDLHEAPEHPHNFGRGIFVEVDGVRQPAPMPRFSRTPGSIQSGPARAGSDQGAALRDWGASEQLIAASAAALARRGI